MIVGWISPLFPFLLYLVRHSVDMAGERTAFHSFEGGSWNGYCGRTDGFDTNISEKPEKPGRLDMANNHSFTSRIRGRKWYTTQIIMEIWATSLRCLMGGATTRFVFCTFGRLFIYHFALFTIFFFFGVSNLEGLGVTFWLLSIPLPSHELFLLINRVGGCSCTLLAVRRFSVSAWYNT